MKSLATLILLISSHLLITISEESGVINDVFSQIISSRGQIEIVWITSESNLPASVLKFLESGHPELSVLKSNKTKKNFQNRFASRRDTGNSRLFVVLDPEDVDEVFYYIEKIGRIEGERIRPTRIRLEQSPAFLIIWPATSNGTETDEDILKFLKWKGDLGSNLASRIYIVIQRRNAGAERMSKLQAPWNTYEYYSVDQMKIVLNKVSLNAIGNIYNSRRDFGGIDVRAAADVSDKNYTSDRECCIVHAEKLAFTGGFSVNVMNLLAGSLNFT